METNQGKDDLFSVIRALADMLKAPELKLLWRTAENNPVAALSDEICYNADYILNRTECGIMDGIESE